VIWEGNSPTAEIPDITNGNLLSVIQTLKNNLKTLCFVLSYIQLSSET